MAKSRKAKRTPKAKVGAGNETPPQPSVAVELGRMAKLFALYLMRGVDDERTKAARLNAVGFSAPEIAALLGKTVANVRVQISQAKTRRDK